MGRLKPGGSNAALSHTETSTSTLRVRSSLQYNVCPQLELSNLVFSAMSSSREEECAPSYPFFAHAWPYTDSKDLNAHHSVPVESYYLQDYGIFSMDGFTSEDLLSPANVTDYSPATPGSEVRVCFEGVCHSQSSAG